jgi:hypothetical protein
MKSIFPDHSGNKLHQNNNLSQKGFLPCLKGRKLNQQVGDPDCKTPVLKQTNKKNRTANKHMKKNGLH